MLTSARLDYYKSPMRGAPGKVYKQWGQFTKDFRYSNLGYLNYLSLMKQSNIIDSVQCVHICHDNCTNVSCANFLLTKLIKS